MFPKTSGSNNLTQVFHQRDRRATSLMKFNGKIMVSLIWLYRLSCKINRIYSYLTNISQFYHLYDEEFGLLKTNQYYFQSEPLMTILANKITDKLMYNKMHF